MSIITAKTATSYGFPLPYALNIITLELVFSQMFNLLKCFVKNYLLTQVSQKAHKNAEFMKIKKYNSLGWVVWLLLLTFMCSGCSSMSPFGDSIAEYDLDGKHEINLGLMPGEKLAFEMRNPGSGGYQFDGVSFDPELVSLDKFTILEPESGLMGDFGRWRFEFTTIGLGASPVIINIKRAHEDIRDAYKVINMNITKDGPPFWSW